MNEPNFELNGADVSDAFYIKDGGTVVDTIKQAVVTGKFNDFDFVACDTVGNEYFLECLAFITLDRLGTDRLYLALKDLEDEVNSWHVYYLVQDVSGMYFLIHEDDERMHETVVERLNALPTTAEIAAQTEGKNKSKKGWHIAFKIILFPFWLTWQFIKAILSLFNIAVGDSSAVKSFKNGYHGDEAPMKEYTFTNSSGCTQTIYSSNGREFYGSDGSFVGTSNDGGKTITEE